MVVSIIDNEDSAMRQLMESHLVNDLQSLGYNATAYTSVFKKRELKNMRYDSVKMRLINLGIDGVVTISLVITGKESVYVKDKEPFLQNNGPLNTFWESPTTVKQEMGKPGYYTTFKTYYWESHLYDVANINLVYSVRSKTFDVGSVKSLAHKYGKMIVADMQKNYLLIGE